MRTIIQYIVAVILAVGMFYLTVGVAIATKFIMNFIPVNIFTYLFIMFLITREIKKPVRN